MNATTTITLNEMEFIIKDFLTTKYGINEMPKYCFNGRLGKRTVGQFWYSGPKKNTIEIAKKFKDIESAMGTLLHEIVHYAVFKMEKDWHDGTLDFESELMRFELPTNYRRQYFMNKFGKSYGELCETYFEQDMVEHYTKIIKERRRNPENVVVEKIANIKPAVTIKEGVKLEKTRISTMLHEFKMDNLIKGTNEYILLTNVVDSIDNTPAKDKEAIVAIYENFLRTYIEDKFKGDDNKYDLVNKGLKDVILLINSKVCDKYINDTITGFAFCGQL